MINALRLTALIGAVIVTAVSFGSLFGIVARTGSVAATAMVAAVTMAVVAIVINVCSSEWEMAKRNSR